MKSTIRRLPDAELNVMQAVWACDIPACRTDIEKFLPPEHPIATTTLLTLLTRLTDKGVLAVQKKERKSYYTPLIKQEDYLAAQGNRFFKKLCGGNVSSFASALCNSGLTKEELAELRDLLDRGTL